MKTKTTTTKRVDSGAWKPLLLLPFVLLCIAATAGKVPPAIIIILFLIASVVALIILAASNTTPKVKKPHAEVLRKGEIHVTGNIDRLSRRLDEASGFEYIGNGRWIVHLNNLCDLQDTQNIADSINLSNDL